MYTLRSRFTGQGNDFELIPTVQMESQHSVGVPTCHDFPRFVIISEKSRPEVGIRWRCSRKIRPFWAKRPLTGKFFINVSRKDSWRHTPCLRKNCANFFLSEFPQISTNFGNLWQKVSKEAKSMRGVLIFPPQPNSHHHTIVLNTAVPNCYTMLKLLSAINFLST